MPYINRDKQREYARKWRSGRRDEWLSSNGPCRRCWSNDELWIYYPDRSEKIEHRIWTWKKERRDAELKKCIILCRECWKKIEYYKQTSLRKHGTITMYHRGRCRCPLCREANRQRMEKERGSTRVVSALRPAILELNRNKEKILDRISCLEKEIEAERKKLADIDNAITALVALVPECDPIKYPEAPEPTGDEHDLPPNSDPVIAQSAPSLPEIIDPETEEVEPDLAEELQEEVIPAGFRKCTRCGEVKELNIKNFNYNRRSESGYFLICNNCNRKKPLYLRKKSEPPPPSLGSGSKLDDTYSCKPCRTRFMSQAALDAHNLEYHSGANDHSKCPVTSCRKKFQTQSELDLHVVTHHPKYAKEYGYA